MNKLLLVLVLSLILSSCTKKETPPPTLPLVQVVQVKQDTVQIEKDFVGQVYGSTDLSIRARVEGFLDGIHFKEGEPVKKGQLLYTIESQPYRESLAAAESQLTEAQVRLTKAINDYKRIAPLADMKAVSERDRDAATAEKEAAEANVMAAEARMALQKIQLGYTRILSPVNGLIGKTNAKEGEFVGRSPNPVILNTVSTLDSVRVEFFITENDYLKLASKIQTEMESGIETPPFKAKLILSDGQIYSEDGRIIFVNRQIDASTGALLVQSIFPNADRLIRPGQFAKIRVTVDQLNEGLLIPQRCVSEFQGKFSVMSLSDSSTIVQKPIEIISTYRDYYIVKSGLSARESIVYEGLQKAKNGIKVTTEQIDFQSQFTNNPAQK